MKLILYFYFALFAILPFFSYITSTVFNIGGPAFIGITGTVLSLIVVSQKIISHKPVNLPNYLVYYGLFVIVVIVNDIIFQPEIVNFRYFYLNWIMYGFFLYLLIENSYVGAVHIRTIRRLLYFTFFIAFVVILIQDLVDPLFFVNETYKNFAYKSALSRYELRLPSIFNWAETLSFGFGFIPLAAILVNIQLVHKKTLRVVLFVLISLIYSFLTRERWVMVGGLLIVIMTAAYMNYGKKIQAKIQTFFEITLLLSIFLIGGYYSLKSVGVDIDNTIRYRILEQDRGGLENTSAGGRLLAFGLFARHFIESPILGSGGVKTESLMNDIGARSSQIHVGFLSLFYYWGIFGGMFFVLFLYHYAKCLYKVAIQTNYWASYIAILFLIISNMTLVWFVINDMGFILALLFHRYLEIKLAQGENVTNLTLKDYI